MKYLFFALRPKQWVKNLFVFFPLIFGKKLFAFPVNFETLIIFFVFCIISSSVYLVNDLIDIKKDRMHPTKRLRPIASGKINTGLALAIACLLGIIAITASFLLSKNVAIIVMSYFVLNIVYSFLLKNMVIIDVFCISGFFLLRIMAGSAIANLEMSQWIIIMTALLALFLGFNKRRQEIRLLKRIAVPHREVLSKYSPYFIDQMTAALTASIVVSYILYTVDEKTVALFGGTHLMYSVPFVFYGIFRYMYLIHVRIKDGDPTRVLFSDKKMQINLLLWISVCIGIVYFKL